MSQLSFSPLTPVVPPTSRRWREDARAKSVHVSVDWSVPETLGARGVAPGRLQLEAVPTSDPSVTQRWIWSEAPGASWETAVAEAGCDEIVLTAQLGDDADAKHLVFGLAEQLTHALAASHPTIRVRFLAAPSPRARRRREPTNRQ